MTTHRWRPRTPAVTPRSAPAPPAAPATARKGGAQADKDGVPQARSHRAGPGRHRAPENLQDVTRIAIRTGPGRHAAPTADGAPAQRSARTDDDRGAHGEERTEKGGERAVSTAHLDDDAIEERNAERAARSRSTQASGHRCGCAGSARPGARGAGPRLDAVEQGARLIVRPGSAPIRVARRPDDRRTGWSADHPAVARPSITPLPGGIEPDPRRRVLPRRVALPGPRAAAGTVTRRERACELTVGYSTARSRPTSVSEEDP